MYSKESVSHTFPSRVPPPPPPRRNQRTTSEQSDITMSDGDFSLPMEYSESSDDLRGEEGFLRAKLERDITGSSTFRLRSDSLTKSSRVVRFDASTPSILGTLSNDDDDDDDDLFDIDSVPSDDDEAKRAAIPSSLGSNVWKVVSTMAHAVNRSPHPPRRPPNRRKREGSLDTLEYPHHVSLGNGSAAEAIHRAVEQTPLLPPRHEISPPQDRGKSNDPDRSLFDESGSSLVTNDSDASDKLFQNSIQKDRILTIAAAFLLDYEDGRPPSLPPEVGKITSFHLALRQVEFSFGWRLCLKCAGAALFFSSCFEGSNGSPRLASMLNFYAIVVLVLDLLMTGHLQKHSQGAASLALNGASRQSNLFDSSGHLSHDSGIHVRQSRVKGWRRPLALFLVVLSVETTMCYIGLLNGGGIAMWSSTLKPIALFYISTKARDALEALNRIAPIVARVIIMELFLILCFAAVACRLYPKFDSFRDLSTSFVSLFELSTTVVNPSMWMPMYNASRKAAFFFIFFVVTSVFYLHSLVLSVVFQTYIQAATEIHDRSIADREDAVRLAFLALHSIGSHGVDDQEIQAGQFVPVKNVRKTLQLLRPHYNAMKINALIQIVDPADQQFIDFPSFRTKIRQALNASIRSTRNTTTFSLVLELVAALVAVTNFLYVILLTSSFDAHWFDVMEFPLGCAITILGAFDLIARFNPCKSIGYFTPMTRLSGAFDGLAALAAIVSFKGIWQHLSGIGGEYLLMGRAIDMIRIMRFFKIFRDIVRRSAEVLPALIGPLVLVTTSMHVFTYIGMALWGREIEVGKTGADIEPLYDLNNFNSYISGVVTMFQVLVVNDWHAIAYVFLHAQRFASPLIVYPFFIGGNLVSVSILLNVLTAFFVGSFVTKLTDSSSDHLDSTAIVPKPRDFDIKSSSRPIKRVSSEKNVRFMTDEDNSTISSAPELQEFDVFEREGFDKIMQTVAGNGHDEDFARKVCDYLEVFESLSPGREKVGYMTCCQKTMNRYGNRRFQTSAREFIADNVLHAVVSDMHSELLALTSRRKDYRSLHRVFPHKEDSSKSLEISASLLRDHPAASLFVSRIVDKRR